MKSSADETIVFDLLQVKVFKGVFYEQEKRMDFRYSHFYRIYGGMSRGQVFQLLCPDVDSVDSENGSHDHILLADSSSLHHRYDHLQGQA